MLPIDDPRWNDLEGGYRTPYDPRGALARLEPAADGGPAWDELWNELHHQGDVGTASYAAVPHLVARHTTPGWRTYGLVATIELARDHAGNPAVPTMLESSYDAALQELASKACLELRDASDPNHIACLLAAVALAKGRRTTARLLLEYDEAELAIALRAMQEA